MISVLHRNNWGFQDNFEGYIFFKEHVPFAQLHLYKDYHTFFWLGTALAESVGLCLSNTVQEISDQFGLPFYSINTGTLRIGTGRGTETFPFVIERDETDLPSLKVGEAKGEFETFLGLQSPVSFSRFDVDSSRNLPLILWADLGGNKDAEIGFSSLTELPSAVLQLLVSSCKIELTKEDLNEISGQVSKRTPVFA